MPGVTQTQPLDATQLVSSQLDHIERNLAALAGLPARMDALNESTRKIDATLRESVRNLQTQDASHQKAIEEIRLQQSQMMSTLSALSARVNEFFADIPRRLTAVEEWLPWLKVIRWAATIVAGIVVTLFAGALVWLVVQYVQSQGGVP